MAQEYTVKDVKVWPGSEDPKYGSKMSVAFVGISEPVDMQAIKLPVVGETEYGDIVDYTTQKGVARQRFKRARKDDQPHTANKPKQDDQYWDERNDAIKAQWAIGQAANWLKDNPKSQSWDDIEGAAQHFYAMVDRVKAPRTGYDTFKANKPQPKDEDDGAEFASALAKGLEADDIDLSEIPF